MFTKANKEQARDSRHAIYCLISLQYAFESSEELKDNSGDLQTREIRFDSIGRIKTSLYSSPIEDAILQEMGVEIGFELEKLMDQPEFLANFLFLLSS